MGLAVKNNNPGNLKDPATGSFRSFDTPQDGYVALMNDLQGKIKGSTSTGLNGGSTLFDFSKTWAPSSDNNNPAQYTVNLANQLKVSPDTKLSDLANRVPDLASAIAHNEDGEFAQKYPLNISGQQDSSNPSSTSAPQSQPSWWDTFLQQYSPESMGKAFADNPSAAGAGAAVGTILTGGLSGVVPAIGTALSAVPGLAGNFLKFKAAESLDKGVAGALGLDGQPAQNQGQPQQTQAPTQPDPMAELNALSQSQAASKTLHDTLSQQMGTTQSGRDFLGSTEGKQALETASHYGYAPEVDENGILNSAPALEKLRANQKDLVNLEKKIAGEGNISTLSAANEAGKYMASAKEMANLTPKEREQVATLAREEIMSYSPANRPMSNQDAIEARHQQYAATRGKYGEKTSVQIAAHKVAAAGFRNAVKNSSKNPESYEKLLKEEQKHINAERLLKKVHNKRALQNNNIWKSFLKGSARYAETYIGEKLGGALGAVAGLMIGEHLNRKIDKRFGKTVFETAGMRAAMDTLKDAKPDVYKKIVEEMKQRGIDADLNEPGESPEVPSSRTGIREDIEKNMAVMDKSKEGLIKLKNPGAFTRSSNKSLIRGQSKGLPAT